LRGLMLAVRLRRIWGNRDAVCVGFKQGQRESFEWMQRGVEGSSGGGPPGAGAALVTPAVVPSSGGADEAQASERKAAGGATMGVEGKGKAREDEHLKRRHVVLKQRDADAAERSRAEGGALLRLRFERRGAPPSKPRRVREQETWMAHITL